MGKTVIVTGGGRGIGRAIVERLVAEGHEVVCLVRDPARAQAEVVAPGARWVQGDLSSLRQARLAAEALLDDGVRPDVLLHNAGVWPTKLVLNEDGLEQSFVVNHLSPLLLSWRLMPRLAQAQGRVVQVSAGLYVKGVVDLEGTPTGASFSALRTYADTKLCNLLCCKVLAEAVASSGVTVNAVHPGVIRTGLGGTEGALGWLMNQVKRLWGTPEEGADGPVHLALAEELAGVTGRYFDHRVEVPYAGPGLDDALARAVYDQAMGLIGVAPSLG